MDNDEIRRDITQANNDLLDLLNRAIGTIYIVRYLASKLQEEEKKE